MSIGRGSLKTQVDARFYDKADEVHFSLKASSVADVGASGLSVDSIATDRHKKDYPKEWKIYQASKIKMAEISVPEEAINGDH